MRQELQLRGRRNRAPNDTETTSPLSPLMGPPDGLGGVQVSLNTAPGTAGGAGAGPGLPGGAGRGRGLSCTCRSARSCWTTAPPWACDPRSRRWAVAPKPAARSTVMPKHPGCVGCRGQGPAGGPESLPVSRDSRVSLPTRISTFLSLISESPQLLSVSIPILVYFYLCLFLMFHLSLICPHLCLFLSPSLHLISPPCLS